METISSFGKVNLIIAELSNESFATSVNSYSTSFWLIYRPEVYSDTDLNEFTSAWKVIPELIYSM